MSMRLEEEKEHLITLNELNISLEQTTNYKVFEKFDSHRISLGKIRK